MKRLLVIGVIIAVIYSCSKETDAVYDSHLFQALQAQNWVLDYATITDSLNRDTTIYATDTVKQISQFNSQLYTVKNVRVLDSMRKDSVAYQVIYDNPNRIYLYDAISQQILQNQYLNIDTVNTQVLVLTQTDTLKNLSRRHYHAQ